MDNKLLLEEADIPVILTFIDKKGAIVTYFTVGFIEKR